MPRRVCVVATPISRRDQPDLPRGFTREQFEEVMAAMLKILDDPDYTSLEDFRSDRDTEPFEAHDVIEVIEGIVPPELTVDMSEFRISEEDGFLTTHLQTTIRSA